MTVKTGKVAGRRELHFENYDDLLAEVDRLAAGDVERLGNWSLGTILGHLARVMNASIDGFGFRAPWLARVLVRTFLKRRFLTRTLPAGFRAPKQADPLVPMELSDADGLEEFRHAVERQRHEAQRSEHPVLGSLTRDEWDRLHMRHAELHLSFVVPREH